MPAFTCHSVSFTPRDRIEATAPLPSMQNNFNPSAMQSKWSFATYEIYVGATLCCRYRVNFQRAEYWIRRRDFAFENHSSKCSHVQWVAALSVAAWSPSHSWSSRSAEGEIACKDKWSAIFHDYSNCERLRFGNVNHLHNVQFKIHIVPQTLTHRGERSTSAPNHRIA